MKTGLIRNVYSQFISLIGWLLCLSGSARAQQPVLNQSLPELSVPVERLSVENLDLGPFSYIWADSASSATYATVSRMAKLSPFPAEPLKAYGRQPTVWLRFQLQNPSLTDTLHRLFFGGYHYSWGLSQSDAQHRLISMQDNGWLFRKPVQGRADAFTLPIMVPPGQTRTIWFQTTGHTLFSAITPRLFTPAGYERFRQNRFLTQWGHFGYYCLIIGICLFLSLFAGFQAAYARDVTYAYWSMYLATTGFLFVLMADLGFNLQLVGPTVAALNSPLQYLIEITYLLFLRSFLQLNQHIPRLNRLILIIVWCLPVLFVVAFWSVLTLNIPVIKFLDQVFLATQIVVLLILVAVSRAKVPNRQLFIIGSLGLTIMSGVATGMNEIGLLDFDRFWTDLSIWFSIGIVFELICFNLALSQRGRLIEREKQRLEYDKSLENQRVNFITEQFQQRIAETEMVALRSQMNPHFIFNCLNSIQFFTARNDAERATDYLTKFSRLIRLVLENSKSERVTLANELETLRLYIEMEAMRFPDKLHYVITVGASIDTESIQIPPLLLQPFVENAIWHGLMHKDDGGKVSVSIEQGQNDRLHVAITDDGIGRQQAALFKSKSATRNKSFGMKLTAERIDLINKLYHTQTQVQVIDLTDDSGKPIGTNVLVDIPI